MKKKSIKEFFRKFMVSLKRRPHNIPLVLLLISYIVYSFSFDKISYTTALIGKSPMGLCTFIVMLFSLLGMVSFMNAFPVRQKPKMPMVIIFYVIQALILAAQITYLIVMINRVMEDPGYLSRDGGSNIMETEVIIFVHIGLFAFSTLMVPFIPMLGRLFNKIDTSVAVEENEDIVIDIEQDEEK